MYRDAGWSASYDPLKTLNLAMSPRTHAADRGSRLALAETSKPARRLSAYVEPRRRGYTNSTRADVLALVFLVSYGLRIGLARGGRSRIRPSM